MERENDGEEGFALDHIFIEPPRPPTPEATTSTYIRAHSPSDLTKFQWKEMRIRLVGSHPLWGHHLWNAARAFADFLDASHELCRDKCVLELGAGGGLPGLIATLLGARKTVLTDYPDQVLLDNLLYNVEQNIPESMLDRVNVLGYIWGAPVAPLLNSISSGSDGHFELFDIIILSDLIFNHSQHDALLRTCDLCLRPNSSGSDASVLVFYTHHRPLLADRDLEFFSKAQKCGWLCEEILEKKYSPMFPNDPGAEEVRSTVHGWKLTRSNAIKI